MSDLHRGGHLAMKSTGTAHITFGPSPQIFSSGTIGLKGNWITVLSAIPYNAAALMINLMRRQAVSGGWSTLIDIGVGSAPSNGFDIVENLLFTENGFDVNAGTSLIVPVQVAAGQNVIARSLSSSASVIQTQVGVTAIYGHGARSCQKVISIGADLTGARGIPITPGTNTKPAWTVITGSLAVPIRGLFFALGSSVTGSNQLGLFDLAYGAPGLEKPIATDWVFGTAGFGTTIGSIEPKYSPVFDYALPAGERIVARMSSNQGTPHVTDVIVYGLR